MTDGLRQASEAMARKFIEFADEVERKFDIVFTRLRLQDSDRKAASSKGGQKTARKRAAKPPSPK